jgi:hypothetical protein
MGDKEIGFSFQGLKNGFMREFPASGPLAGHGGAVTGYRIIESIP